MSIVPTAIEDPDGGLPLLGDFNFNGQVDFFRRYLEGDFDSAFEKLLDAVGREDGLALVEGLRKKITRLHAAEGKLQATCPENLKQELSRDLAEVVGMMVRFLLEHVVPFIIDGPGHRGFDILGAITGSVASNSTYACLPPEGRSFQAWRHTFALRNRAGLLRKNHVRIYRLACEAHLRHTEGLLKGCDWDRDLDTLKLVRWADDEFVELLQFIIRIRSERLEILLLKYLDEPDINMEVARKLMTINVTKFPGTHWYRSI
ncbi:hypothetical protein BJ508DRAFT_366110 [Ascobolus immersus RN42]|uniref:Uncharacterized protein n=1 Tax=Ascobolus immersus RN42 TaxID=1160509 RepID=A0A3N4HRG3_ASCIM|nr:hypothetical protein BJ508DRAFT_366110 [Ascobolus immersus RN42]